MNGSIRTEILTRDWQPIPGYTEADAREIQGDALDHAVHWSGNTDVASLIGKEVRLKFYMTRARLHTMTFCNDVRTTVAVEPEYRSDIQGDSVPQLN